MHVYPLMILERHLDTFGHVNNATYLELFEEARWDMIHRLGYGLEKILSSHQGPVVLEVSVRFQRELLLRSSVVIKTEVISRDRKISTLRQLIEGDQGKVYATAEFKIGLMDLEKRCLIDPTPDWKAALGG
jgi:acyl-CoA thioester hydrolase